MHFPFGRMGMKRFAALMLVLSISWQPAAGAESISGPETAFSDVVGHWANETIRWAVARQIAKGYEDGTFRPDQHVSEAEFLALILRAVKDGEWNAADGGLWYEPYYSYAGRNGWPVERSRAENVCTRGWSAVMVTLALGLRLDEEAAIQYLLDENLARGKSAKTLEGFAAHDPLTRAEALQLIRNVLEKRDSPDGADKQASQTIRVAGIALGDSEQSVVEKLGEPARVDTSEYGFEWYVYNRDYADFALIGIQQGKVVAVFSNSGNWTNVHGIGPDSVEDDVTRIYGEPLEYILKDNTRFILPSSQTNTAVYLLDEAYVTFFYDRFENQRVMAVQAIAQPVEESLADFYGAPSEALRRSFEMQSFDLANATRVAMGLKPFEWDDRIAEIARKHSRDMAEREYFGHTNLMGQNPFDRMRSGGILYSKAAENIAAGLPNAIFAHAGWINSAGHRKNVLGDTERLGVGVHLGGEMRTYYTQNFYSPL